MTPKPRQPISSPQSRAEAAKSAELSANPKALYASLNIDTNSPDQIIARLVQMPRNMRRTYGIAMRGRSMKAAIKSQCYECMGYNRNDVPGCTDHACPLYPYRPGA